MERISDILTYLLLKLTQNCKVAYVAKKFKSRFRRRKI